MFAKKPAAPRTVRDRTCLITGAASGIGRATAVAAAAEGGRLCLTDVDAAGLEETVAAIRAAGGTVLHAAAVDLADYDAVARMAADVHAAHGSMDVVMNVAGIARDRYLVFTSADVRHGHYVQRKFALPDELAMRFMHDRLVAVTRPAAERG
jgi:NAD(P)-dependent dehydrogenase (short-subunit alcohol dehydrogenase family)